MTTLVTYTSTCFAVHDDRGDRYYGLVDELPDGTWEARLPRGFYPVHVAPSRDDAIAYLVAQRKETQR
jgi:hypothetical protein